jgi:hypothetical protein
MVSMAQECPPANPDCWLDELGVLSRESLDLEQKQLAREEEVMVQRYGEGAGAKMDEELQAFEARSQRHDVEFHAGARLSCEWKTPEGQAPPPCGPRRPEDVRSQQALVAEWERIEKRWGPLRAFVARAKDFNRRLDEAKKREEALKKAARLEQAAKKNHGKPAPCAAIDDRALFKDCLRKLDFDGRCADRTSVEELSKCLDGESKWRVVSE